MTEYIVLRPFVDTDNRLIDPSITVSFMIEAVTPFHQALIDNGFLKKASQDYGVIATSKLAGVEIADQNYTEGGKEHFTFDEALEVEKKLKNGWRLPTRHEWALICEEFACDEDGKLSSKLLMKRLNLPMKGWTYESKLNRDNVEGNYWSSVASTATNGHHLGFVASGVYPSSSDSRAFGFPLRFVRDIKGR